MIRAIGMLLLVSVIGSGCATVRPWQRDHLALPEMSLDATPCHRFELSVEVYREGVAGANGGKSGGGCGCT